MRTLIKKRNQGISAASGEQGFSLIEVMIASSILIFLAYSMASHAVFQDKVRRTASSQMDVVDLKASLAIALSQEETCAATFGGLVPPATVSSVKTGYTDTTLPGSPWTFTDAFVVGSNHVINGSFYLNKVEVTGSIPANNTGVLTMGFDVVQLKIVNGSATLHREIPLRATVDGAGKITKCQALPSQGTKSIVCADQATQCPTRGQYCNGDLYANDVDDCLCQGTLTSGLNLNGYECGAGGSPAPSPTPSPSGGPSPGPSPTGSPSCASLTNSCTGGAQTNFFHYTSDVSKFCMHTGACATGGGQGCTTASGFPLIVVCSNTTPTTYGCSAKSVDSMTYYEPCP